MIPIYIVFKIHSLSFYLGNSLHRNYERYQSKLNTYYIVFIRWLSSLKRTHNTSLEKKNTIIVNGVWCNGLDVMELNEIELAEWNDFSFCLQIPVGIPRQQLTMTSCLTWFLPSYLHKSHHKGLSNWLLTQRTLRISIRHRFLWCHAMGNSFIIDSETSIMNTAGSPWSYLYPIYSSLVIYRDSMGIIARSSI